MVLKLGRALLKMSCADGIARVRCKGFVVIRGARVDGCAVVDEVNDNGGHKGMDMIICGDARETATPMSSKEWM
jgi:hypothetical protein